MDITNNAQPKLINEAEFNELIRECRARKLASVDILCCALQLVYFWGLKASELLSLSLCNFTDLKGAIVAEVVLPKRTLKVDQAMSAFIAAYIKELRAARLFSVKKSLPFIPRVRGQRYSERQLLRDIRTLLPADKKGFTLEILRQHGIMNYYLANNRDVAETSAFFAITVNSVRQLAKKYSLYDSTPKSSKSVTKTAISRKVLSEKRRSELRQKISEMLAEGTSKRDILISLNISKATFHRYRHIKSS